MLFTIIRGFKEAVKSERHAPLGALRVYEGSIDQINCQFLRWRHHFGLCCSVSVILVPRPRPSMIHWLVWLRAHFSVWWYSLDRRLYRSDRLPVWMSVAEQLQERLEVGTEQPPKMISAITAWSSWSVGHNSQHGCLLERCIHVKKLHKSCWYFYHYIFLVIIKLSVSTM